MCSGKLHCLSRTKQQNRKHHPAMPVCVCARVPLSVCVWSEPATATIRGRTTRARTTSSRQENSTNKTAEKRQRKRKSKTEEQITQQTTNDKGGCNTHTHSTTQHSTAQHSRTTTPAPTHPPSTPLAPPWRQRETTAASREPPQNDIWRQLDNIATTMWLHASTMLQLFPLLLPLLLMLPVHVSWLPPLAFSYFPSPLQTHKHTQANLHIHVYACILVCVSLLQGPHSIRFDDIGKITKRINYIVHYKYARGTVSNREVAGKVGKARTKSTNIIYNIYII